jgi:transposase InsO family protein
MPDKAFEFEYAEFAITTPESAPLLQRRIYDICRDVRPESVLESILADELIHAGWEMDRIRQLAHHRDAEPRLAAANARASRNWHRARKYLKKLQRAEASAYCTLPDLASRDRAASCPLADLTKLPQPFSFAPEVQ